MKKFLTFLTIVLVGVVVLTGCGKKEEKKGIVGSWAYNTNYVYTFNADGTGNYDVYGSKTEFTYTTEGNKISILYTGDTDPFETEYSIDGDKLNIKDSFGNDTIYKRK